DPPAPLSLEEASPETPLSVGCAVEPPDGPAPPDAVAPPNGAAPPDAVAPPVPLPAEPGFPPDAGSYEPPFPFCVLASFPANVSSELHADTNAQPESATAPTKPSLFIAVPLCEVDPPTRVAASLRIYPQRP